MAARKNQGRSLGQSDAVIDLTLSIAAQMAKYLCDNNPTPGQIEDICIASLSMYGDRLRRLCKVSPRSRASSTPA